MMVYVLLITVGNSENSLSKIFVFEIYLLNILSSFGKAYFWWSLHIVVWFVKMPKARNISINPDIFNI